MSDRDERGAAFLDRDGTIIEDVHYIADPALVRLHPGAAAAIAALNRAAVPVIPEADPLGLLTLGLVALGVLLQLRRLAGQGGRQLP